MPRIHHICRALTALVAVGFVGCGDPPTESKHPPALTDSARARSIVVDPASITMIPGDSLRFVATVRDSANVAIAGLRVRRNSSDTTLLTVDSTGMVVAKAGPGGANVTASFATLQTAR